MTCKGMHFPKIKRNDYEKLTRYGQQFILRKKGRINSPAHFLLYIEMSVIDIHQHTLLVELQFEVI